MLLELEWYWWLIIFLVVISIPFKVKFMTWWSKRHKEQGNTQRDKWGGEE